MIKDFTNDLVSVIIPVYNSKNVILSTLKSVINQTYKPIEIVIVDDNSKDGSDEFIREILNEYPQIVYFRQDMNYGAGVARNKGLELATGQYVAFLDADDVWSNEKIYKQVNLLRNINEGFSYTAIQMIDYEDQIVKTKRKIRERVNYRFLLRNTMIATSSVLIDRNLKGDFRMSTRRGGQDYATWLMLLRDGRYAYGINEALVNYRVGNKQSLASNKWKSIKQVWEIQTIDEKLNKIKVSVNVIFFILNALKKYLL